MQTKINEGLLYNIELEIESGKSDIQIGHNVYSLPKLEGFKARNPKPKRTELREKAMGVYIKAYGV